MSALVNVDDHVAEFFEISAPEFILRCRGGSKEFRKVVPKERCGGQHVKLRLADPVIPEVMDVACEDCFDMGLRHQAEQPAASGFVQIIVIAFFAWRVDVGGACMRPLKNQDLFDQMIKLAAYAGGPVSVGARDLVRPP